MAGLSCMSVPEGVSDIPSIRSNSATPSAPGPRLFSQVLTDTESFASIAAEWDELIDDSNQRSYFLRWRWNYLWWTQLAPAGASLRIVVCRNDFGQMVGLCPLYQIKRRVLKLVVVRELVFLGTGIDLKTSEHLDVAVRRGYERAATESMAAAISRRDDWDRISCSRVPEDSAVLHKFLAALNRRVAVRALDRAPYIDTSLGWAAYKSSLGRSMRRNVEYYARRMFKRYTCDFRRVATFQELTVALDALVKLHVELWRSRGEVGSLSAPTFQKFLIEVAKDSFLHNRLLVWTLQIDGRIEGVLLGFVDGGTVHYFQNGYNPRFASEDLGTVLVSLCVRDCCDDVGIRAFDFMGGGAGYKHLWARQVRVTVAGEVDRANARVMAMRLQNLISSTATAVYRAIVPMQVRALRRDRLKARYFHERLGRVTQSAAGAAAAVTHLVEDPRCLGIEWANILLPILLNLTLG
jgi:CelD/BcsL family acetyltransferase involved in cellulose biosynthesis